MLSRSFGVLMVLAAVSLLAIGCAGPAASGTPGVTVVNADLKEFSITLDRATVPAGQVEFRITNSGALVHEFVVIDTDLAADGLPVVGAEVDEAALAVMGEVEDIAVGASATLPLQLLAGHYVLLCNIEGHYASGMRLDLTVQ